MAINAYRVAIDGLAAGHVIWAPYGDHRAVRAFDDRSWVSGFIRWGSHVFRYLPERVTRQFGYVQMIPGPPPHLRSVDDVDQMWDQWGDHAVDIRDLTGVAAETPGACTADYMPWFVHVSHPWALPGSYQTYAQQYLPEPVPEEPQETVPPLEQDMREIVQLAQRLVRQTPAGHPQHEPLARILLLATRHLPERGPQTYQRRRVRPRTEGSST